MMEAEEILGAALDVGMPEAMLDQFLAEFDLANWVRHEGRAYPPNYVGALGRYRCNPQAVEWMRQALSSVPRVRPQDYDILFNLEGADPTAPGPSWDIVKWMDIPEHQGCLPGYGFFSVVLQEPYPVYSIPATRSPMSLSTHDFNHLLKNATTMRGGGKAISEELWENNLVRRDQARLEREEADLEFAEYYRTMFKRTAEEMGI